LLSEESGSAGFGLRFPIVILELGIGNLSLVIGHWASAVAAQKVFWKI
jgi:hypothetical protein